MKATELALSEAIFQAQSFGKEKCKHLSVRCQTSCHSFKVHLQNENCAYVYLHEMHAIRFHLSFNLYSSTRIWGCLLIGKVPKTPVISYAFALDKFPFWEKWLLNVNS